MRIRLGLAASALLLGSFVVPATAGPASPSGSSPDGPAVPEPAQLQEVDGELTRSYSVPTRHGALYLEVVHPTLGGEIVPAHGILTLSPYSVLGRNRDRKDWVPRGYARMYADVVGTGNSGGCFDYGGHREKESAHDLVEWIAQQPWSQGRVGMAGGSYDGTTATAAAVTRPEGLATIVPEVGISRWYDYAYSDGMRYFLGNETLGHQGPGAATDEGFDTPLAFDFGLALPPPVDAGSPDWKDRVADNLQVCEELEHTERGYDTTPTYDAFWDRRDYAADAGEVTIPVMVAHNWGDWNVKQDTGFRLFEALTSSKERRLYFGTRWEGHGRPGGNYKAAKLAWMDRWVGGVKNGVERALPTVVSQTSTSEGAGDFIWGRTPRTTPVTLSSDASSSLVPTAGEPGASAPQPFVEGTESAALSQLSPAVPSGYVVLQTAPLKQDTRIFGSPTISLKVGTGRTWTTLAPAVVDVDPATRAGGTATDTTAAVAVTRGWQDTRYAGGLDRLAADEDGDGTLQSTVTAKPMDWTFKAGHRIALVVQTSSLEWTLPKAYDGAPCPTCASWSLALGPETSLTLPVVGKTDPAGLFAAEE